MLPAETPARIFRDESVLEVYSVLAQVVSTGMHPNLTI